MTRVKCPYHTIAVQFAEGFVVPFIGAGASAAGVPAGQQRLPIGRGLATELIASFGDYPGSKHDPLTKVAQYYEECILGRTPVYRKLRKRFFDEQQNAPISPAAQLLARMTRLLLQGDAPPPSDRPLIIVTTNYDDHVERALELVKQPYVVLAHSTNPYSKNYRSLLVRRSDRPGMDTISPKNFVFEDHPGVPVVYKMHGGFANWLPQGEDTLVLTEDDYIHFMTMSYDYIVPPPALAKQFQHRHFLFLGYSLADWNFRVLLRRLQETADPGDEYMSWAIQRPVSSIEKQFWDKRRVQLHDVDLTRFVEQLEAALPKTVATP